MERPALKVDEVAAHLRVTRDVIYAEIKKGRLRAVRVGSTWRVRAEDLDEYMGVGAPPVVDTMDEKHGEYEGRGWGDDE